MVKRAEGEGVGRIKQINRKFCQCDQCSDILLRPPIDQTSLCYSKARRGGGGRAKGDLIYFCGGIRGQILCLG